MSDNDVIVFLHIQKTAGTSFERFLVKHLNVSAPCICHMGKKRCTCIGPGPKKKVSFLWFVCQQQQADEDHTFNVLGFFFMISSICMHLII